MQNLPATYFVLPAGFTLSGVTNWALHLSRRLADEGHPAGIIQHPSLPPTLEVTLPPPVRRLRCRNQAIPFDFYTAADAHDFAADYQTTAPATLVLNGGSGTFAACALLSQQAPDAFRFIAVAHADEPAFYEWLSYYEPIIHKFIAVSPDIAAHLTTLMPHRAPDIATRAYAVAAPPVLSRTYSAPGQPLQLMYAGRLIEKQKRVSDLVELARRLKAAGIDFHVRLVGDGPAAGQLKQAFRNNHLDRQATLAGNLPPDQVTAAWQQADICLLVSEFEGTSVSMLEAMAQGCVPVVTQVSGTASVITAGENGFLVPVGDVASMAQFIARLSFDRQQLQAMGQQAHQTAATNFSYPQYVPWFTDLAAQSWQAQPRRWPAERPLHPCPTTKEKLAALSAEQLSGLVPASTLLKALGFQLTRLPGLGWMVRFRGVGKKLLGG